MVAEQGKLGAVVCHDANVGRGHARHEEGVDELADQVGFGGVDDAVSFCFFAGRREESVGVQEEDG